MPKIIVTIQAKLAWNVFQDRASKCWIGICEPLQLTLQGETYQQLMTSIGEGVQLLFNDLLSTGELDQFLNARGWKANDPIPKKQKGIRFDVPYSVKLRARYDTAAALN